MYNVMGQSAIAQKYTHREEKSKQKIALFVSVQPIAIKINVVIFFIILSF